MHVPLILIIYLPFFLYCLLGTLDKYLCVDVPFQLSETFNSLVQKMYDDAQWCSGEYTVVYAAYLMDFFLKKFHIPSIFQVKLKCILFCVYTLGFLQLQH